MKNIKYISAFTLLSVFAYSQTYVTDNIVGFDADELVNSGYTITPTTVGNEVIYDFTQTGDLDGLGIADDTFSFTVTATYLEGTTFDGTTLTLGTTAGTVTTSGTGGLNWGSGDSDEGDSLVFSLSGVSYTRGENGKNDVIFNGFTQTLSAGNNNVTDIVIGEGTDFVLYDDATRFTDLDNTVTDTSQYVYNYITRESGGAIVSLRDLDFSFQLEDTIPEPSSAALLGLGGLALIARRRRS